MGKAQRQHRQKSKSTTDACHAVARQIHATKKRSQAQARISKSQVADATDQINGEFARVQTFYIKAEQPIATSAEKAAVPEASVQDLADVMRGL